MLNDILNVNVEPFDEALFEYNHKIPYVQKRRQYMMITLFSLYFKKLLEAYGEVNLPLPELLPYLTKNKRYRSPYESNINIDNILENIGDKLLASLERWSSFVMETVDLSSMEELLKIDWEEILELDNEKRAKIVKEDLCGLWNNQQMRLYRLMPEPIYDCMDFQCERKAVYYYSERLVKYIRFTEKNPEVIINQFRRGHEKIIQTVSVLQHPMQGDWIRVRVAAGQYYVIGFYMGSDMESGLSNKDYNWNFFVALYVLEKLLDLANSFFHFEESE